MERVEHPIGVTVHDVSLSLQKKKSFFSNEMQEVKLLHNITADIQGGQLVAIMGGSGMWLSSPLSFLFLSLLFMFFFIFFLFLFLFISMGFPMQVGFPHLMLSTQLR